MSEPIPPLRRPEDMPPIHTQDDLHRHWRALMGELGFGGRSLWLQLIGPERQCTPLLTRIEELPVQVDDVMCDRLMEICAQLVAEVQGGGEFAFLLSRPGGRTITDSDRTWAVGIVDAARRHELPCAPVHLANDEELRVLAPDDLALPKAG